LIQIRNNLLNSKWKRHACFCHDALVMITVASELFAIGQRAPKSLQANTTLDLTIRSVLVAEILNIALAFNNSNKQCSIN
jgi:hypothetical protein